MANMMRRGEDYMARRLEEIAATAVTYSRFGDSVSLTVSIVDQTSYGQEGDGAMYLDWESRDFLVRASSLVLPSYGITEPVRGDIIDDGTFTFEVMSPGQLPVWEWYGNYHIMYRVHTKEVGSA